MDPVRDNPARPPPHRQHNNQPRKRGRHHTHTHRSGRSGNHQWQPSFPTDKASYPANNSFKRQHPPSPPPPPPPTRPNRNQHMPTPQPEHAPTAVWKSADKMEQDEYSRTVRKVKQIAPEFIRAGVFPNNQQEWKEFKLGRIQDQLKETQGNTQVMQARMEALPSIPKNGRTIKSVFGPDGKVFGDDRGPVLAMPTIWAAEHSNSNTAQGVWPSQAEMLMHGDNRDAREDQFRTFPPPRAPPVAPNQPYHAQQALSPLPLDEIKSKYEGWSSMAGAQKEKKDDFDDCVMFNTIGQEHLGNNLMSIIGRKKWKKRSEKDVKKEEAKAQTPIRQPYCPSGLKMSRRVPNSALNASSPAFIPVTSAARVPTGRAAVHQVPIGAAADHFHHVPMYNVGQSGMNLTQYGGLGHGS